MLWITPLEDALPGSLKAADAMNALRRSNRILNDVLRDMTQEQAVAARDGADGWNVVEIVCHLCDLEAVYQSRARRMLAEDNPALARFDHLAAVTEHHYAQMNLRDVLNRLNEQRALYLGWLAALTPEQWDRPGIHPDYGPFTITDAALRTALHDINHTEQILKALGRAA